MNIVERLVNSRSEFLRELMEDTPVNPPVASGKVSGDQDNWDNWDNWNKFDNWNNWDNWSNR
jgi:hypothetical protein